MYLGLIVIVAGGNVILRVLSTQGIGK